MFRPLALPALAVLLWCVARAPNAPTYELPLEQRAEEVRDPGPDPSVCPLGLRQEDDFPGMCGLDLFRTNDAIERESFGEPGFPLHRH